MSLTDAKSLEAMEEGPGGIKRLKSQVCRELRASGAYGGACVVHHVRSTLKHKSGATRYHVGQNYVSLHFHFLIYGWLEDSRKFHKRTGWVLHNLGIRDDPDAVIAYLLDHALVLPGRKQTLTWFGELSYNRMKRINIVKETEPTACHCGHPLHRYATNPSTGEIDWWHPQEVVTRTRRKRTYHLKALDPPAPNSKAVT